MTDIAIKDGRIELEDFKKFSRWMHGTYFPVKRWIGMFGPQVSSGLNQYGKVYTEERYKSSWFAFQDKEETLNNIKNMLEEDIPVVMAIGFSNSGPLNFYVKKNDNYVYETYTSQHLVTITGLYIDKTKKTHKTMLEISSWGKKHYIDYEEYVEFCEHFFGVLSNGTISIEA